MKSKLNFSVGYLLSIMGLGLLIGVIGTLFIMHFLVGANAIDPESMYTVKIEGEEVSCLSLSSIQAVCNASRELTELAYQKGLTDGRGDVSGIFESFTPPKDCVLIVIDAHGKNEVCKGDELYTAIMEDWPYD